MDAQQSIIFENAFIYKIRISIIFKRWLRNEKVSGSNTANIYLF
jgi:hypothetical protein